MTERLDRIESSIEQLNTTLNVIASEFIRPIAQQARQNHERLEAIDERLDRIAASLEATAQQSTATEQQCAKNAEAISELTAQSVQSDTRFNILIQEMRSDRRASQQATQALLLAMANVNSDVAVLGDRVDQLEQAS